MDRKAEGEEGKVMTLINVNTIDKNIISTWSSKNHNIIYVTLRTGEGTILIANAYFQTNLDHLNEAARLKATEGHWEINGVALDHNHAIVCMDANETRTPQDRAQLTYTDLGNVTVNFSGTNKDTNCMSCYDENFIEAHESKHPDLYLPNRHNTTYTHEQTGHGLKVLSKIDYVMISKSLKRHLTSCDYKEDPRHWGSKKYHQSPRLHHNYHKAIITRIHMNLNPQNSDKTNTRSGLKGGSLPMGPNYNKLTPENEREIAKQVEYSLAKRWKNIRSQYTGRAKSSIKTETLKNILKNTIDKICTKVLGKKKGT